MKNLFVILLFVFTSVVAKEQDIKADKELSWQLDGTLNGYFQNVSLDTGSNDKEGFTQAHELDLRTFGPLANGEAGLELRARGSNDVRAQDDNVELLSARAYYNIKKWNYGLGDVAALMNPYVYSGSLKGLKIEYKGKEKAHNFDLKMIGGIQKNSWRELYEESETDTIDTYIAALRLEYTHARAKKVSLSAALLQEELKDDINTTQEAKKGISLGVDGQWRFSKYITLKGRGALSKRTYDVAEDESENMEYAILLRLLTRPILSSVKSNFVYQRISPDFFSLAGSASTDKEQLENSTTWKINKEFRFKLALKANRDNLNGDLNETRNTYYELATLTYQPKILKRSKLTLKLTNKNADGRAIDMNKYIANIKGDFSTKGGFRYGLGYSYTNYTDKLNDNIWQKINNIRGIFGYKVRFDKESSFRFNATLDAQNFKQFEDEQTKYGVKLSSGYRHNRHLDLDLSYISKNTYKDKIDALDTKNDTYQFRTTYKLDERGKQILRLLLEQREYAIEENDENSYVQQTAKLSYVMNF